MTQLGGADVGRRITCVAENDKATPLVVDRVQLEVASEWRVDWVE